jgi:hypothetical protein
MYLFKEIDGEEVYEPVRNGRVVWARESGS